VVEPTALNGDGAVLPSYRYHPMVTLLAAENKSPVTARFFIGDTPYDLFGDYDSESNDLTKQPQGSSVEFTEGSQRLIYDVNTPLGVCVKQWQGNTSEHERSLNAGYIFRAGDEVQQSQFAQPQSDQTGLWEIISHYVSDGKINIDPSQLIVTFEVGAGGENKQQPPTSGDYQDAVFLFAFVPISE